VALVCHGGMRGQRGANPGPMKGQTSVVNGHHVPGSVTLFIGWLTGCAKAGTGWLTGYARPLAGW
jgi:hypothetical protein